MPKIATMLLEYKANPNAQQSDGNTSLHLACFKGDIALVELLIKYGADSNMQNTVAGRTPLHVAVDGYHESIVEILVKAGASIDIQDHFEKTPLDYAETKEMKALLMPIDRISMKSNNEKHRFSKSTVMDIENKENCAPDQRLRNSVANMSDSSCKKREGQIVSFEEYLKRSKVADAPDSQTLCQPEPAKDMTTEEGKGLLTEEGENKETEEKLVEEVLEEELKDKFPELETLKEENSDLEVTTNVKNALENQALEIVTEPVVVVQEIEIPQPPASQKKTGPVINEVLQYEEVAKDKSPRDTSIHYQLANTKNRSLKAYDMPLKMDTTAEMFIHMDTNQSQIESMRNLEFNMNYYYPDVTGTFLCEPSKSECSIKFKGECCKGSHRNVQQSSECSLQATMTSEGAAVAVFKSQKNDVPMYVNERKRLNVNKSDNKVVADIYNELLNQMQNYSKIDNNNNTSVEYGDSIFFETVNDNYEQFEKMIGQTETGKTPDKKEEEIVLEPESPTEHNPVLMKNFPVNNCGLQFLTAGKEDEASRNIGEAKARSFINEDLDRWLESIELRSIGSTLAKSGITSKEAILRAMKGLEYDAAMKTLKKMGVQKRGARDRIIIVLDQESGTYKSALIKLIEEHKAAYGKNDSVSSILGCCGKLPRMVPDLMHPPSLKLWLGRQNLASVYHCFASAGYDDYEWILAQMCSSYPLTDSILAEEVKISQASIRTRLLYKLKEGIINAFIITIIEAEEYCELILMPKYGLGTKYEGVDQATACGCFVL